MGQNTLPDREMQMQRLKIKQLNQQMQNLATAGTGISTWEARELVNVIEEVYFSDPDLKLLLPEQMKYSCVSTSEPPGKPIKDCQIETGAILQKLFDIRKQVPFYRSSLT